MFFGDDGTFALVDWQMAMRSPGNTDLVYFVATNLTPDVRRRHERELLERYRQRMVAAGATGRGLTEDGLLRGYREGVLFWCVSMGSSILTLDPANERGAALLDALVERLYVAADDLDCGEIVYGRRRGEPQLRRAAAASPERTGRRGGAPGRPFPSARSSLSDGFPDSYRLRPPGRGRGRAHQLPPPPPPPPPPTPPPPPPPPLDDGAVLDDEVAE